MSGLHPAAPHDALAGFFMGVGPRRSSPASTIAAPGFVGLVVPCTTDASGVPGLAVGASGDGGGGGAVVGSAVAAGAWSAGRGGGSEETEEVAPRQPVFAAATTVSAARKASMPSDGLRMPRS